MSCKSAAAGAERDLRWTQVGKRGGGKGEEHVGRGRTVHVQEDYDTWQQQLQLPLDDGALVLPRAPDVAQEEVVALARPQQQHGRLHCARVAQNRDRLREGELLHKHAERHQHDEQARGEDQPRHRFGGGHADQREAEVRGSDLRAQQVVDRVGALCVAQLDHDAQDEEEHQHQPDHARDRVVRALPKRLSRQLHGEAEQGDQQPDEEPQELVAAAVVEVDEEQEVGEHQLLDKLHHLKPEVAVVVVEPEEVDGAGERVGLVIENGVAAAEEERSVQQRERQRPQHDEDPCRGVDGRVLGGVALDVERGREVRPELRGAGKIVVANALALEGEEERAGDGGQHAEGDEDGGLEAAQ